MAWHIRRQCNWLSVFQVTLNKKQWSYHSTILKQFNTSDWNDEYSLLFSVNYNIFQQNIQLYKISSNNSCTSPSWTKVLKTTIISTKNWDSCRNIFNYKSSPYNLNTFIHYSYLWLITGSNLKETLLSTVQSPDRVSIFTYLHQNCQYTKQELIIWVSRSSIIFLSK